jgi:hypothetical protein
MSMPVAACKAEAPAVEPIDIVPLDRDRAARIGARPDQLFGKIDIDRIRFAAATRLLDQRSGLARLAGKAGAHRFRQRPDGLVGRLGARLDQRAQRPPDRHWRARTARRSRTSWA